MPLAKPGGFRRLAGFHIGLYFWESACCGIPQSRLTPCQLPLTREPFLSGIVLWCDAGLFHTFNRQRGKEAAHKHTKPKRGQGLNPRTRAKAKGQSRLVPPGGFLRGEQFERERVVPPLSRLLCFLSCRSKKGRPRWQALAESRLENRLKGYNRMSITTSKYHPISKTYLRPPLAPSVTCGDSSLPEGAIRLCYFTLACAYEKVPAVNPSVTAKATGGSPAVPAPTGREPLGRASGAAFMYCGL